MSIISAINDLDENCVSRCAGLYYGVDNRVPFTGASFETLGEEDSDPSRITPADLYATGCLGVPMPIKAGIGLLGEFAGEIRECLKDIPNDRSLAELSDDEYRTILGEGSPAWRLWDIIRANGREKWGVGSTRASKLMARKRPRLIPIEDSVVNRVIGFKGGDSWWLWREALTGNKDKVERMAAVVRRAAGRHDLTTLRALDVALWMKGKRPEINCDQVNHSSCS